MVNVTHPDVVNRALVDLLPGGPHVRRLAAPVLLVAAVALTLVAVYGVAVEPRLILDEQRHDVVLPRLPQELEGTTLAVLSDLQVGMWWANTAMVGRVVERWSRRSRTWRRSPGTSWTAAAPTPRCRSRRSSDCSGLCSTPVSRCARCSATTTTRPGPPTRRSRRGSTSVGLGPARVGRSDPQQALDDVPADAPRVVLMHHPTGFPALHDGTAPLALAGHTHCGQIALPGTPRWSYLGLTEEEAIVADGFAPPALRRRGQQHVRHVRGRLQPAAGADQRAASGRVLRALGALTPLARIKDLPAIMARPPGSRDGQSRRWPPRGEPLIEGGQPATVGGGKAGEVGVGHLGMAV